jgi:hypothetical protein
MLRWLGILALVAACNPAGLTLEVAVSDPEIVKVELFAGDGCGSDCPRGTKPPELAPIPIDAAYVVTDPQPFVVTAKDFEDGVAGFRIETTEDTSLPILVAVGYDAQGEVRWSATFHDVAIPHEDSAHWRIEMTPTAAITAPYAPQPAGTERVKVWREQSMGRPACLLLEHWSDQGATRELVGPVDDPDCDEVDAQNECAPWIPNAMGALPTLDTANCLVSQQQPSGSQVCMIGGPQCNETAPQTASCVPLEEPYCTPLSLCECAADNNTLDCVTNKIIDATTNGGSMPHLACKIMIDEDRNRCDGSQLEIDGSGYLGNTNQQCTSIGFNELASPVGAFEDYLPLGTAKIKLEDFSQPCKANVTWVPGSPAPVTIAMLELALDNGYHLVVPARIEVVEGPCDGTSSYCELLTSTATDETMWECAGAPPAPLCLPDSAHGCEGPMCNGECCGAGEACTADGCTCGGGAPCEVDGDTCQAGLVMENQCGDVCCGASTPCPQ